MEGKRKFRITLTPAGKFFFGKENIRINPQKEKENSDAVFYFSESEMMPQQTALLGMLRFTLLQAAPQEVFSQNRICDKEAAKELIGEKSFAKGETGKFGLIDSIGPCGLQIKYDKEEVWQPLQFAARDYGITVSLSDDSASQLLQNKEITKRIVLGNYKAKDGLKLRLIVKDGEGKVKKEYTYNDIFKEVVQVGIRRNIVTGHVEDESFYKQKYYCFADEYNGSEKFKVRFCFDAAFSSDRDWVTELNGRSVQLGADDSRFILGIEEVSESGDFVPTAASENDLYAVTLLSDSYLTPDDTAACLYNISDIVPFRSLATSVDNTENYYARSAKNGVLKSERSYLYKRGSVFFFGSEEERNTFIDNLEGHSDFFRIGYNRCYSSNKNK